MNTTPVHEYHNPDLLRLLPPEAGLIVEVGCSSGALAREYKKINPDCHYVGIEIDNAYARLANRHCDEVIVANIEALEQSFYTKYENAIWVFGDTLEHLINPGSVLARIRQSATQNTRILACIPNAQHWSVIAKLITGNFQYQESGLLDRTHLRWFTRKTIIELFKNSGFSISNAIARVFNQPTPELAEKISEISTIFGENAETTKRDIIPLQYVVLAQPH